VKDWVSVPRVLNGCGLLTLFRGSADEAAVHFCVHYRNGVPRWGYHPVDPLLLRSESVDSADILVHFDRSGPADLRGDQVADYRGWKGSGRGGVWGGEHAVCGRDCGGGSVRDCAGTRGTSVEGDVRVD
jgi:hypothetical protein